MIEYKARRVGITVKDVNEAWLVLRTSEESMSGTENLLILQPVYLELWLLPRE